MVQKTASLHPEILGKIVLCAAVILLSGCMVDEVVLPESEVTLSVSSPAFSSGESIPARYTCEGENISPALNWGEAPPDTQSFVLIVDDPDAPGGTFTHWVLFNVPVAIQALPEAVSAQEGLPQESLQIENDFGDSDYSGPCPPPGKPHHYRFTVYALERRLELPADVSRKQLIAAMEGYILARGQLTGTYQR